MTEKEIPLFLEALEEAFPHTECFLRHESDWQLLIAILLSAQTTDRSVNEATKVLFGHFPTLESLSTANVEQIEEDIRRVGLARSKARNVRETARLLLERHQGKVPQDRRELEELPGVGHKTSGVFLAEWCHEPYLPVDTHVLRVSTRLGLVPKGRTPDQAEALLERKLKGKTPIETHRRLILLGRTFCSARRPRCLSCPFLSFCKEGKRLCKKKEGER